jgi:hypothetical protein
MSMNPQHITGLFLIAVILVITGYDLYAWYTWGGQGTISGLLTAIGKSWPMFPYFVAFAMGCLFGHFFLQ